jgi:hypothetical protein
MKTKISNYLGAHVGWKVARAFDAAQFIGTVKRLFPGAVVE